MYKYYKKVIRKKRSTIIAIALAIFPALFFLLFLQKRADRMRYDISMKLRDINNVRKDINQLKTQYDAQTSLDSLYKKLKKYGYMRDGRSVTIVRVKEKGL